MAAPGCGYKVYISKEGSGHPVSNHSQFEFRILGAGQPGSTISISSPHGGEHLASGFGYPIEWQANGASPSSDVRFYLLNSQGGEVGEITAFHAYEGHYNWTVGGFCDNSPNVQNGYYQIKAVLKECKKVYEAVSPPF
jgi:hypothetical protein